MKSIMSSLAAIITALASSACCVGPLMALAGFIGISASQLIWLSSIKNYLIMISLISIAYNLYRSYFPKSNECCVQNEVTIAKDSNKKQLKFLSVFHSRKFLWTIAGITILILILPYLNII